MRRLLSAQEAEDAIYIDFESLMDAPPVLLGSFVAGPSVGFHQLLISENLPRLPGLDKTHLEALPLGEAVRSVIRNAQAGRRVIAAWSSHEMEVVSQWSNLGPSEIELFENRYINCIPTAKAWKSRVYPDVVFKRDRRSGRNRLYQYVALAGYDVPKYLGMEQTAQRLRYVLRQLESRHGRFESLTPVAKAKWTKVLQKNMHDCIGLRALMGRATAQLASRTVGL